MRILITGATGFIGKEVGKRLVSSAHEIVAVSRSPERARLELPFPAEIHYWEGHDKPFPLTALKDVDAVVHLAGASIAEGRWTKARKQAIRDSRLLGTRQLVDAIASHPAIAKNLKTFVLGSAIGIYSDRGSESLTESSEKGSGFLADVVEDWEIEGDRLSIIPETRHVRLVKIRTGVVLGRGGGALEKMWPVFTKGLGGKLGRGDQWMSWIHLTDLSRLVLFSLEKEQVRGIVNGVSPDPVTNRGFTRILAKALGVSAFIPVPSFVLRGALGELATALLGSQKVLPRRAIEFGFEFEFPRLEMALAEICKDFVNAKSVLHAEQWIPKPPKEVFPFFCSAANLEKLTPTFVGFQILGQSTPVIKDGTLIDYRISLHGIPMKWQTRIDAWVPDHSFVDSQLKGPYTYWRHTHEFVPLAGGTLMRDTVSYRLPFGLLGDLVAGRKVAQDVANVFSFRRKKIDEIFAQNPKEMTVDHVAERFHRQDSIEGPK